MRIGVPVREVDICEVGETDFVESDFAERIMLGDQHACSDDQHACSDVVDVTGSRHRAPCLDRG